MSADVLWARLPTRTPKGREQTGTRPVILIAEPARVQTLRFPLVLVASVTSTVLPEEPVYPRLARGAGGLPSDSTVLLDQLLALDPAHVTGRAGTLTDAEFAPIRAGLRAILGFH